MISPRTDADELFDHEVNYQLYYYMSSTLLCGRLFIVRIFAKSMEFRYYLPLSFTCHCLTDINCLVVVFLSCDRLDGTRWSDKAQDSTGIDGMIRYNHLFVSFWVFRFIHME